MRRKALALLAFLTLAACAKSSDQNPAASSASTRDETPGKLMAGIDAEVAAHRNDPMPWIRRDQVDGLTGKPIIEICTAERETRADGDFALLCIRQHPRGSGPRVVLRIQGSGDFGCFGPCALSYRLDDQPIQQWVALRADSLGPQAIYLNDSTKLAGELQTAKRFRIEAPLDGEGLQTLTFDLRGLKWPDGMSGKVDASVRSGQAMDATSPAVDASTAAQP